MRPALRALSTVAALAVVAGLAGPFGRPAAAPGPPAVVQGATWRSLETGLDLGEFPSPRRSHRGDSIVRVLRIDPLRFELRLLNASAPGQGRALTAREWSLRGGLAGAINASMYQADHRTSVSLMRTSTHINNGRVSKDRAILAFEPKDGKAAPVLIIDRECDDFEALRGRYGTLVQSIRMLSCTGENVWSQQSRRWSAAAIGTDDRGRVLFVHVRSPYSVHDLIGILKDLPLGLSRMLYAEGGPEAQLYVRSGGEEHEWIGGYESGLSEDEDNRVAWPVPNVVGIARRPGVPAGDRNPR
jgi:phosphodiester glycosidase